LRRHLPGTAPGCAFSFPRGLKKIKEFYYQLIFRLGPDFNYYKRVGSVVRYKIKTLSWISVMGISRSQSGVVGVVCSVVCSVFFSNAWGKSRSTITTSKLGVGFKTHCHWFFLCSYSKTAWSVRVLWRGVVVKQPF
jgi:hypothetical protein